MITAMSARCFIDMRAAKAEDRPAAEVSAIVAQQCVPSWKAHSVEEILESIEAPILIGVMREIVAMTELKPGKSEAGRTDSSS